MPDSGDWDRRWSFYSTAKDRALARERLRLFLGGHVSMTFVKGWIRGSPPPSSPSKPSSPERKRWNRAGEAAAVFAPSTCTLQNRLCLCLTVLDGIRAESAPFFKFKDAPSSSARRRQRRKGRRVLQPTLVSTTSNNALPSPSPSTFESKASVPPPVSSAGLLPGAQTAQPVSRGASAPMSKERASLLESRMRCRGAWGKGGAASAALARANSTPAVPSATSRKRAVIKPSTPLQSAVSVTIRRLASFDVNAYRRPKRLDLMADLYQFIIAQKFAPRLAIELYELARLFVIDPRLEIKRKQGDKPTNTLFLCGADCVAFAMLTLARLGPVVACLGIDCVSMLRSSDTARALDNFGFFDALPAADAKRVPEALLDLPFGIEADAGRRTDFKSNPALYQNRVQVIDAFHALHKGFRIFALAERRYQAELRASARAFIATVHPANIPWFARLFVRVLIESQMVPSAPDMRRRAPSGASAGDQIKRQLLEQRLSQPSTQHLGSVSSKRVGKASHGRRSPARGRRNGQGGPGYWRKGANGRGGNGGGGSTQHSSSSEPRVPTYVLFPALERGGGRLFSDTETFFYCFLHAIDSYALNAAVSDCLVSLVRRLDTECQSANAVFSRAKQLRLLAKFLGYITSAPGSAVVDAAARSNGNRGYRAAVLGAATVFREPPLDINASLRAARRQERLLLVVPWVCDFLRAVLRRMLWTHPSVWRSAHYYRETLRLLYRIVEELTLREAHGAAAPEAKARRERDVYVLVEVQELMARVGIHPALFQREHADVDRMRAAGGAVGGPSASSVVLGGEGGTASGADGGLGGDDGGQYGFGKPLFGKSAFVIDFDERVCNHVLLLSSSQHMRGLRTVLAGTRASDSGTQEQPHHRVDVQSLGSSGGGRLIMRCLREAASGQGSDRSGSPAAPVTKEAERLRSSFFQQHRAIKATVESVLDAVLRNAADQGMAELTPARLESECFRGFDDVLSDCGSGGDLSPAEMASTRDRARRLVAQNSTAVLSAVTRVACAFASTHVERAVRSLSPGPRVVAPAVIDQAVLFAVQSGVSKLHTRMLKRLSSTLEAEIAKGLSKWWKKVRMQHQHLVSSTAAPEAHAAASAVSVWMQRVPDGTKLWLDAKAASGPTSSSFVHAAPFAQSNVFFAWGTAEPA